MRIALQQKKDQQNEILDRLFDYFSKPKGEKPTSENDVEVRFYRSSLTALPHNFHDNEYNGVNIIMLLQAQEESEIKVPIYSTFKQAADLLAQHKDQLPAKSEMFNPEKPLKGITLDAQIVKYLETYKENGKLISKSAFEESTQGMSFTEMKENGYQQQKGLKPYRVFPIEKIKHLLPESFINEREYFAQQDALEKQKMSPEMEDQEFVEKAQFVIEAMGVPVIEKNQDRAFYSVKDDCITIPPRHKFKSDKAYFAILLHELSHSTGHPSRLNRNLCNPMNSKDYANYLESWANHFKDKKKALLNVCSQAKTAQLYISQKVLQHQLILSLYSVPKNLDFELKLGEKYSKELTDFIKNEAKTDSSAYRIQNAEILGYNRTTTGIDVFTAKKQVSVKYPLASKLVQKLEKLRRLQSLFSDLDINTDIENTEKTKKKRPRLSM